MTTVTRARINAWRDLTKDERALDTLADVGPGDLRLVERGCDRSNLVRLLDLAESAASTRQTSSAALHPNTDASLAHSVVPKALGILAHPTDDHVTARASVGRIVRLTFRWKLARVREKRNLTIETRYAREVVKTLIDCVGDVQLGGLRLRAYDLAKEMAGPYLCALDPTEPLSFFFAPSAPRASPARTVATGGDAVPAHLVPLKWALDDALAQLQTPPLPHNTPSRDDINQNPAYALTPEDLLRLIAPKYLSRLQSAPEPPLGISSTYDPDLMNTGQLASAFAGKVYSEHEFRNRGEGLPNGLSAAGPGSIYSAGVVTGPRGHPGATAGPSRGRASPAWTSTVSPTFTHGGDYAEAPGGTYGAPMGQTYNLLRGLGIRGVEEHSYGTEMSDPREQNASQTRGGPPRTGTLRGRPPVGQHGHRAT